MNILHLSDLHFGRDQYKIDEPFSKKKEILDKLILKLAALDLRFKPDLVLVTGDIAWHGLKREFDEAYEWFSNLKSVLDLPGDCFVFCPGNHDLNRNVAVDFTEGSLQTFPGSGKVDVSKCDYYYQYRQAHILENRFQNYNRFCEQMGMQPYSYNCDGIREYSYLIGNSSFVYEGCPFCIVCLNTAYLPYGNVLSDDQMFLGLPQIEQMHQESILAEEKDDIFRIALFHHADRFLHPNEQCEYDGRKAPMQLLLNSVDLALCGHTETGSMPRLVQYQDGGSLLSGGATYYNDDHPNSFSIISASKDQQPLKLSFHFKEDKWVPYSDCSAEGWEAVHGQIRWNDAINNRKEFGFGCLIDGKLKIVDYAYYDIFPKITESGTVYFFNNSINPARSLDIYSEEDPDYPGKMCVRFRHGPCQKQMTESLLMMDSINTFLATNLPGAKNASFGLFEMSNGISEFATVPVDIKMLSEKTVNHRSNEKFYQRLQELEEFYGVLFKLPVRDLTKAEKETIDYLYEIREYGNLHLRFPDIPQSDFYAHNPSEINWIYQLARTGQFFAYKFSRKLKVELFGVDIRLETCAITLKGARPKNIGEIEYKMKTWAEGDVRKIETEFPDGMDLWISPVQYQGQARETDPEELPLAVLPENAPLFLSEDLRKIFVEY